MRLSLLFEPRDLWVGLYVASWRPFDGYLTAVPMLPVRLEAGVGMTLPQILVWFFLGAAAGWLWAQGGRQRR